MGVNINREYLNNLQFTDDLLLMSESLDELQKCKMTWIEKVLRLKINRNKTKETFNYNVPKIS